MDTASRRRQFDARLTQRIQHQVSQYESWGHSRAPLVYAHRWTGGFERSPEDHPGREAGNPVSDVQSRSKGYLAQRYYYAGASSKNGSRLYIHGAINQDPSTTKNPVQLFDDANFENADFEVVLPAPIDETTAFSNKELKQLPGTFAMVHSKVVLVDPFGAPCS